MIRINNLLLFADVFEILAHLRGAAGYQIKVCRPHQDFWLEWGRSGVQKGQLGASGSILSALLQTPLKMPLPDSGWLRRRASSAQGLGSCEPSFASKTLPA